MKRPDCHHAQKFIRVESVEELIQTYQKAAEAGYGFELNSTATVTFSIAGFEEWKKKLADRILTTTSVPELEEFFEEGAFQLSIDPQNELNLKRVELETYEEVLEFVDREGKNILYLDVYVKIDEDPTQEKAIQYHRDMAEYIQFVRLNK